MHDHTHNQDSNRLFFSALINVILTVVEFVAGILTGSLSLIADSLHNLSDAGSLVIAAIARKVAGLPSTDKMSYGYQRAEVIGALINGVSLGIVGCYLIYEAIDRFSEPIQIEGKTVIVVALVALVVDIATALLTRSGSKRSINIKAAFIHNITDALASVAVIISGVAVVFWNATWVDLALTILISVYVLYHGYKIVVKTVLILMQAVPSDIALEDVREKILSLDDVSGVEHLHVWEMSNLKPCLEVIVNTRIESLESLAKMRITLKKMLLEEFKIAHSTIELRFLERPGGIHD